MTPDDARRTIAQALIRIALEAELDRTSPHDYPEFSDADYEAIRRLATEQAPAVDDTTYAAAYELLATRGEAGE